MKVKDIERGFDGKLPTYAWPGGYPFYYLATDMGILCPKCANSYVAGRDTQEQLEPIYGEIHWEGEPLICEHCNTAIESAYGNPNEPTS